MITEHLRCTCCSQKIIADNTKSEFVCVNCGAHYNIINGIIDLVDNTAATALDNINYDKKYSVEEGSERRFGTVWNIARPYLEGASFTNMLEIGAGTGLFTTGLLKFFPHSQFMVSDVSVKMLAICRARLEANGIDVNKVLFATLNGISGTHNKSQDIVWGNFIIHHIIDYKFLLNKTFEALKNDGFAVFIEPSRTFYAALTPLFGEAIRKVIERGAPENDCHRMLGTYSELYRYLKYQRNPEVIATWEDKHLFNRREVAAAAADAGFKSSIYLPYGLHESPWDPISMFCRQDGVLESTIECLKDEFTKLLPGPFELLPPEDCAPATIWILSKGRDLAAPTFKNDEVVAWRWPAPQTVPPFAIWDVLLTKSEGTLSVAGWAAAERPVQFVEIGINGKVLRALVGRPSHDVYNAMKQTRLIPLEQLICCGVREEFTLDGAMNDQPTVHLILNDGTRIETAENVRLCDAPDQWRTSRIGCAP